MRRTIAAVLTFVALCGLTMTAFSAAASADGDPASDILASQPVYDPPDSGASPEQLAKLQALVKYVSAHGYRLKVAMIASSGDMGSASFDWENASAYAVFYLGIELKEIFPGGRVLVVMPQTDGLRDPFKVVPASDKKAMGGLSPAGSHLLGSAYEIVQRLAVDNGITVPRRLAFTVPTSSRGSSSVAPLIGFVAGLIVISIAWGVSLRVRPLRRKVIA